MYSWSRPHSSFLIMKNRFTLSQHFYMSKHLVKVVKTNYLWELSTLLCNVSISTFISLACQQCNWSSECNAKLIKKWINFKGEVIRKFQKCFKQHLILYVRLWCVLFLCYLFVDYLSTQIIHNEFYSLTICSSNYLIKFWHCIEILFVVIWDHIDTLEDPPHTCTQTLQKLVLFWEWLPSSKLEG